MTTSNDKTLTALATQVWQVDDTPADNAFVDMTTAANDATDANWIVFTAVEAVGDYAAIGKDHAFSRVTLDNANGTAGTVGTVDWEYLASDGTWKALANVVDGTSGFTAAVADGQVITFDEPNDWASMPLNSVAAFYIRAIVTTVYTINPVYDQAFIDAVDGNADRGRVSPGAPPTSRSSQRYILRHASLIASTGTLATWRLVLWDPDANEEVAEVDNNTTTNFYLAPNINVPVNAQGNSMEPRFIVTGQTGTVRIILDGSFG